MGGSSSNARGLDEAQRKASSRQGKVAVSGRYHKLPRRIEDEYKVDSKVLGTGYNGSVYLAEHKETKLKYAVKGFHLHGVNSEKREELETEAEIFLSMDHPHVARLVAVYEDEKMLNLVMECMDGGEVYERVVRLKRFTESQAAQALYQMLLSINYIHSQSIVHRDLKLENFLYERKDGDHLKLIDFGFSKVWQRNTKMDLSCGTLSYVAPEVLRQSYTSQCDLWSLGVIAFILLLGYMPFAGDEDRQKDHIKAGKYTRKPEKWAAISPSAKAFIEALLVVDPSARLNAEKALEHQFISGRMERASQVDPSVATALLEFAEASQFRRACMSVMAWSLTNEERAKVRDAFLAIDTNREGTITLLELKGVLTTEFNLEDERAAQIFQALDTAKNDQIHYSEFLAAMVSTRIHMHDHLLADTFRKFDTDSSGYISLENLKHVLGDSFDGAEVDRLVLEADKNNDGQISYEEFISFLKDGDASEEHTEAAGKIIDRAQMQPGSHGGHIGLTARTGPKDEAPAKQAAPAPAAPADRPVKVKSRGCALM